MHDHAKKLLTNKQSEDLKEEEELSRYDKIAAALSSNQKQSVPA